MAPLFLLANIISISAAFRVMQPNQKAGDSIIVNVANLTEAPLVPEVPQAQATAQALAETESQPAEATEAEAPPKVALEKLVSVNVSLPFGEGNRTTTLSLLPSATISELRAALAQRVNATVFGGDSIWLVKPGNRAILADNAPIGSDRAFTATLFEFKDIKSLVQSGSLANFQVRLDGWDSSVKDCGSKDLSTQGSKSGMLLSTPDELARLLPTLLAGQGSFLWRCVRGLPQPTAGSSYGTFAVTAVNGRLVNSTRAGAPLISFIRPEEAQQDGRPQVILSWTRAA